MCKHIQFVMSNNNQGSYSDTEPIPHYSIQLLDQREQIEEEIFLTSETGTTRLFDNLKRQITEEALSIIESCHTTEEELFKSL